MKPLKMPILAKGLASRPPGVAHRTFSMVAMFATIAALTPQLASAVQPVWTVIATDNPAIPTAGFPSGTAPAFYEVALADGGGGQVRAQLGSNSGGFDGHWLRRGSIFQRFARLDATGSVGPGRSGAESNHVFREITQFADDLAAEGQISILARAGLPGSDANSLPQAVWRRLNGQNVELARFGTDGLLGPGVGSNWRFGAQGTSYTRLRSLDSGKVLIDAPLLNPDNLERSALVLHTPGAGNQACVLRGSSAASNGPNLGNTAAFINASGFFPVVFADRIFINATASSTENFEGIWQVCEGMPRPLAVSRFTGALGPAVGVGSAEFSQIRSQPQPLGNGIAFLASFRVSAGASLRSGIFQHQGGVNSLLAQSDDIGNLGPNFGQARFASLDPLQTQIAGAAQHLAFEAIATDLGNMAIPGLWRIRAQGNPEPVALVGVVGAFAPAPGQLFQRINRWSLFANGDIVAECSVANGPSGLYLFAIGQAPELILRNGQSVSVNTTAGLAQATVNSFFPIGAGDSSQGASAHPSGIDSWAARDGTVLVGASLGLTTGNANALMLAQVSDFDRLLVDGFE